MARRDEFDPGLWEVRPATPPATPPRARPAGGRTRGRFLRGPVPMAWLERASALPGKALAVGVQLWHLSGLAGQAATVRFCLSRAQRAGMTAASARRGVRALESVGLVSVARLPGRGLDVTILECPCG